MVDNSTSVTRVSSLVRADFFWLYLSNAVVLLSGLLVYRFAGDFLGIDGFSEYSLARRTVTFLAPALVMGLVVALPRKMAMVEVQEGPQAAESRFWSALAIMALIHGLLVVAAFFLPGPAATLFFGKEEYSDLILPLAFFIVGLSWHDLVSAFYRGRIRMRVYSLLEILNRGIVPIMVFLLLNDGTRGVLLWTGLLTMGTSAVATIVIASAGNLKLGGILSHGRDLLSYGLPRVPGDFMLGGILGLPSMLAAHTVSTEVAGQVAFGATLLALGGTAVSPISVAMLPHAAKLIQSGKMQDLKVETIRMLRFAVPLALVGVLVAEIGMTWIIRWYLGGEFLHAVPILRVIALCALPYVVFFTLRSIIDAAHHRAVNSRNCFWSLLVFFLVWGGWNIVSSGLGAILAGIVAAHYCLGCLTVWETLKLFRRKRG